jgi:hypothetical protein
MTNEYLVPSVTGLTLCQTKLGNTTIDPLGNISKQGLVGSRVICISKLKF